MGKEYRIKKKVFEKKAIEFLQIFFDNGDYLPIGGTELVDISVRFYDRLILENDDICRVAESGFLKLKIVENPKLIYSDAFLYDSRQYKQSRKEYIENRLCSESGIKCIRVFDENNWHDTLFGNISAQMDGEFLIIRFMRKTIPEPFDGVDNIISLNNITKSIIDKIELDFENCEGYAIYQNEIVDIQLNLKDELVWGSHDLLRSVDNGYIKLKLDKEILHRWTNLFDVDDGKKPTLKLLERRLLGNHKVEEHDICHLYITYHHAGFGINRRECVEIDDLRNPEELERLWKQEEETGCCDGSDFIGGYCERQPDSSILITFGSTAQKNINKA